MDPDALKVELVGGPYDGERRTVNWPDSARSRGIAFTGAHKWQTYFDSGRTTANGDAVLVHSTLVPSPS